MAKKQIISFFLCAVMACTFFPLTACRKSGKDMNNSSDSVNSSKEPNGTNSVTEESSSDIVDSSTTDSNSSDSGKSNGSVTNSSSSGQTYSKVAVAVNRDIPGLPAENSALLNSNPERGFRLEIAYDVQYLATAEDPAAEVQNVLNEKLKQASAEKITIAQVYLYLSGYTDRSISKKGLDFVQTVFDVYRKNKMSMLLRFAYQTDLDRGGAETDVVYSHIKQLAPYVQKNKDVIYAYQAGFVGAWGEWHSESPTVDRAGIMNYIVNNLITNDMYMMCRLPNYKNYVSSSNPRYSHMGFHNDCFFGKRETSSLGGGGIDPGTSQWNQTVQQSPYTPNDAELYWNADLTNRKLFVNGLAAIQMLEEHHFTSMSVLHSYVDAVGNERTSMGDWKKTPVTKEWLSSNGIVYSNSWFTNSKGATVNRNAFEFIRDYMGYRIEAKHITVSGNTTPGASISIKMPVINCGTGAAFNMTSGFAILDKNGKVVSSVQAGSPATWYNTDPKNYSNRAVLTHNISASMKLPSARGQYKLAFYMKNSMNSYARIANNVKYENGFNILQEFAY